MCLAHSISQGPTSIWTLGLDEDSSTPHVQLLLLLLLFLLLLLLLLLKKRET